MITKIIILLTMLVIIGALISGLAGLVRGKPDQTITALTWRIGISLGLFIFLCLAFKFNWLTPHLLSQ